MYNHWQKKWALSLGLLALAMLPAGCGNSIDDQFPFGKNRIHCGGETITVATPFELISNGRQVDLGDRQAETVHAEGHNANMQLLVTGTKEGEGKDAKTLAEEAKSKMSSSPNHNATHMQISMEAASWKSKPPRILYIIRKLIIATTYSTTHGLWPIFSWAD